MMEGLFKQYNIGHFINQPSNPTAFEIVRFDQMEEPEVDEVHKHNFYEILWTENGTSKQTIDYQEYQVSANSLFFISPNQIHEFEEWKPLTGGTILFTEDFFLLNHESKSRLFELSFLDNFYANPYIKLNGTDFAGIKQIIDLIGAEQQRVDKNSIITQSYLHILLAQIQRLIDKKTKLPVAKKYLVLYKQFKHVLDKHFAENQTANFYAQQLFVTQHHLNLICKTITGKTASQVIRARSILEAKRLLTFTDCSVSGIAAQLSYFDSSYFSKVFKSETALSPVAFKNQMSERYRTR